MVLFDSNIFISYFRIEEIHHAQAKKFYEDSHEIIITDYVLSEIYTVLLLKETYHIAKEVLQWITKNPKIQVLRLSNEEIMGTVEFIQEKKSLLSFTDASLVFLARKRSFKLLSFDKAINKEILSEG